MADADLQCMSCSEYSPVPRGWKTYKGLWMCPECRCPHKITLAAGAPKSIVLALKFAPGRVACPAKVRNDLHEATVTYNIGALRASMVMLRRALEGACIQKGAEGGNLAQKIKHLHGVQGVFDDASVAAAQAIRLWGNHGAHADNDLLDVITEGEARRALDLGVDLIRQMFRRTRSRADAPAA